MKREIAISLHNNPSHIIWCEVIRKYKTGCITFCVINGGWHGSIKDDIVTIRSKYDEVDFVPGKIIWEGTSKFHHEDYNKAIESILKQGTDHG